MNVLVYLDAAFALKNDSKSHTRAMIYAGGVPAYMSSRKQNCIIKSPTEAEPVGLMDNLGLVELFQEFIDFVTLQKLLLPVLYQDSTLEISLVTKGGCVMRTRHLRCRMNLAKEALDYGFSKPIDSVEHKTFAILIQDG